MDFSVTPSLAVSRVDGVGPLGVVFDTTATTASSGDAFHDLLYFFDFGDGTSANYTYGTLAGTTKNRFVGGPVSCHVYETPGSYTATLWVYDGSKIWGPVTQAITVSDPDVVYAGTLTTVVSTDGDFTGAPSGAVQVTSSDFDAQAAIMTSNRRVLFKRGQTFDASVATTLGSARSNLYVGAFGAGTDYAVIRATTNAIDILSGFANGSNPANNPTNWRVVGLHFTRADGVTGCRGFATSNAILDNNYTTGYMVVHKCKASKVLGGFFPVGRGNVISACVTEEINNSVAGSGGASAYISNGFEAAVVDCFLDSNGGGEHVVRFDGFEVACCIGNTLVAPAATKHFLTVRGSGNISPSEKFVAEHNIIDGVSKNPGSVGEPVTIQPPNTTSAFDAENVLFENNLLFLPSTVGTGIKIEYKKTTVRNNAIVDGATTGTPVMIAFVSRSTVGVPAPDNCNIVNNSVSSTSSRPGMEIVSFTQATGTTGTKVLGNLAYAPSVTTPKLFSVATGVGTVDSNNSTDSQIKNTDPLFNGALTSMAGFKLQTGSPYKNAGGNFKNWIDGLGYLRQVGGQFDAGALNSVDKQTDAWTLID